MSEVLSNKDADLFDIMAHIFKKIDSLPQAEKEGIFRRCQSNVTIKNLDQIVESEISFFNKREKNLYYDSIEDDNLLFLSSYIDEQDAYKCFLILEYLDCHIDFKTSMQRFFERCLSWQKGIYLFESLNKNGAGIMLPRFIPNWARIDNVTREACNAKPFSLIKRYIWCANCGDLETDHIYVDINPWDKDEEQERLRIVCSPLVDKCPYEYRFGHENDTNYFYINNYPQDIQDIVISRIKETIHFAREVHASIVFFPEMMLSHENQFEIIQMIKDDWENIYPKIIFLPSSEYKEGNVWRNQIIVTNDCGDIIYTYNKQRAYRHTVKDKKGDIQEVYFEPILPDKKLTILHLNKIGRIGILICADIFDDAIRDELCNKFDLDMVLVAAYTSGWDLFDRCAKRMSDTYCEVIVCNACSAIEEKKRNEVYPMAYYSLGHISKQSYMNKKCENGCTGCAFCVEIARGYYEKIGEPIIQKKFDGGR